MKRFFSGESVILRFAHYLTDMLYHAIGNCAIGRLMTSYDGANERFSRSFLGSAGKSGKKKRHYLRRNVAIALQGNAVTRALAFLRDRLLFCSLRTIGLLFLVIGVYSSIVFWLSEFVWHTGLASHYNLFSGLAIAVLGVLLLFSDLSLGYALRKGFVTGQLIMRGLDLSDEVLQGFPEKGINYYVIALPLGMAIGALSAFWSPLAVLAVIFLVLALFLVVTVPESGIPLIFAVAPFVGFSSNKEKLLLLLLLAPIVGYLIKLARGNRAFRMDLQDLPMFLLGVMFLLSAFSFGDGGAFPGAMRAVLCVALYFVVVHTMSARGWLLRCGSALVFSGTITSVIAVIQFIVSGMGGEIEAVRAGFASPSAMAYFLVCVLPFALRSLVGTQKRLKLFPVVATLLILTAGAFSGVKSAFVAMLMMAILFLLLYEKRALFPLLLTFGIFAVIASILPKTVRLQILRFFENGDPVVHVWHLFADGGADTARIGSGLTRFLFGLGYGGAERFSCLFLPVIRPITAENTGFFGYTLATYGIFFVIAFALFLFLLVQNAFSAFCGAKGVKQAAQLPAIVFVLGILVASFFNYVWADTVAMAMFFAVSGLLCAELRYVRYRSSRESRFEENVNAVEYEYYGN